MAQALAPIIIAATGVSGGTAAAITAAAAVADLAMVAAYTKKQEADARKSAAAAPRDAMVRSAIEPAKIVYGRARVSGPVVYTNTKPTPGTNDNNTLWSVVSLASHECADIESIWLDGDEIPSSIINWGSTGGVTSGTYGPISGNEVTNFYRRLGSDSQSYVSELAAAFSDWTTSHIGKGTCYVVSAFELGTRTGEGVWANGAPQNIRAVVKGKKVYDPRLDSTNGGSGLHRLADPATWEWSDNPALCLADYLFDSDLGMGAEGITYSDIDWAMVATAANVCDATVTVPSGGSTKRFTCNGVLDTGTAYSDNIRNLLSSMAGTLTWSGGKYRIRACAYEAPTFTFTEDDIVGDVQVQPERPRSQRFNTVRGTFIDPSADYAATQFLRVQDSDYLNTRDNGQELTTSIALPMTNDEYMAQRLAYKSLRLNNQQTVAVVPVNWKALKVGVGDRINLTVEELSWSSKVFVVDAWSFEPEKGFVLTVREDSASAYTDPAIGDYSVRTATGTIIFNDPAVPSPSGLTATSEEEGILLEWEAPSMPSMYDEVIIYASPDSTWANAVEVGRVRGTRFRHELERGTQRYYWARSEDVDGRQSVRDPDSDSSTITATAGQISTSQLNDDASFADTADWPQITGVGKPEDDATLGATVGQDTFDTDGTTVLGPSDLNNTFNKGKTIALLLNKNSDGTSNSGEGAFVGVNNEGQPVVGTDGFVIFDNVKYTIARNQISSTTFATQVVGKKGYVVYDASGLNFTVQATSTRTAFVYKDGSTWYYDNNTSSGVAFTPTDSMLALAYIETGSADVIQRGGLLAEPVQLLQISEIKADYISTGILDASLVNVTNLNASNINTGTLNAGLVAVTNLNASNINTGTLNASVVGVTNLNADNITTGTLSADNIQIDNVTLDTSGGNLIVKNGGVDTTQIAANAVSGIQVDFNSSTTATTVTNNLSSGYNLANRKADILISTEGGPVDIFAAFEFAASAFYTNQYTAIQMWIYRINSGIQTPIYQTYNPYIDKNLGAQISISYVDSVPAGVYRYELHIGTPVSYTVYGRFPYIRCLELKR